MLQIVRYDEIKDYDFETKGCKNTSSPNCMTGHFTQVVWNDSTNLGIGRAYGMVGQMYCTWTVARYVPPGNFPNKHGENVLEPKVDEKEKNEKNDEKEKKEKKDEKEKKEKKDEKEKNQ